MKAVSLLVLTLSSLSSFALVQGQDGVFQSNFYDDTQLT